MNETKNAMNVHEKIIRKADELAINSPRIVHKMAIGQVVRQGDIYIHRVAEDHPCGDKLDSRQLALGNTTGSRHIADAPAKVFIGTTTPAWCNAQTFIGPCVVSEKRFPVSHPEHAHIELPAGRYQITHQLDAASRQRVED